MLAVPSHTMMRDLETAPPESSGRERRPQRPWPRVAVWSQSLADEAWRRIDVRAGSKGPLVVDGVQRRVVSRTPRRQPGDEELGVVLRSRDRDNPQVVQGDSSLSTAVPETPLWELAQVATAAHRIEACLQRSKSAAGVAEYEGRHGPGWQHHQTRSLLATWFLVQETQRGKKWTPAMTLPQIRQGLAMILREALLCGTMSQMLAERQQRLQCHELARFDPWKQRHRLAPLHI